MVEENLTEILAAICSHLLETNSKTSIDLWFGGARLKALSEQECLAVLCVPSKYRADYVEKNYKAQIEAFLSDIFNTPYTLAVTHEEQPTTSFDLVQNIPGTRESDTWFGASDAQSGIQVATAASKFLLHNEYEFENFVVGNSNNFAYAVCKAVAENPQPMYKKKQEASSKYYNPLLIYGPSGVGKTHLLSAVAKRIQTLYPELSIVYVKGDDFTNEMVESIVRKTTGEFREKYRHAQVLLIDDVQFIAGKEATQTEFFHTFNELYEENCQIILTSDRPPKDIEGLETRLRSRFEGGMTVDIQPPDVDLRLAILRRKCDMCHITPPLDVLKFLAEKLRNNIRQLEGAVKKIAARHMLTGEAINMDMVLANVADLVGSEEPEHITVDRILSLVAQKYNVPVMDIRGKKRTKEIAMARHIAIYLIRKLTEMSYPVIGKELDRDHSSIMSSEKVICDRLEKEPLFRMEIDDMIRELS